MHVVILKSLELTFLIVRRLPILCGLVNCFIALSLERGRYFAFLLPPILYHLGRIFMSQYAYILVVLSLLFLFLVNKYEKEKLQRLLQDQLLKDPAFRATIEEKIQTIENINDVIDYINKGYRLGIPISKEIVDEIRN